MFDIRSSVLSDSFRCSSSHLDESHLQMSPGTGKDCGAPFVKVELGWLGGFQWFIVVFAVGWWVHT